MPDNTSQNILNTSASHLGFYILKTRLNLGNNKSTLFT
jgi:hypothetical protein